MNTNNYQAGRRLGPEQGASQALVGSSGCSTQRAHKMHTIGIEAQHTDKQDADKQQTGQLALEYCALLAICTMTLAIARCMPLSSFLRPGGCSPSPAAAPPAALAKHCST